MRKLKIKKGDVVIAAIIEGSNKSRGINMSMENINEWTFKVEVISATSRYVTVRTMEPLNTIEKFDVELDYKQKVSYGSPNYKLYTSLSEIIDEEKSNKIYKYLRSVFNEYSGVHISLEALEKIQDIICNELK